jgi:hypothetical protein
MKSSGRIAVTALVLLAASAGVLYPLQGSIGSLSTEVNRLDEDLARDAGVHALLMAKHNELLEAERRMADRPFGLCPNTPEAEHEFESSLLRAVEQSGMHRVKMDRRSEVRDGKAPSLAIELVVEGDAFALHDFLKAIEEMRFVTRVNHLAIEPGTDVRRVTIQVAVMLEQKS